MAAIFCAHCGATAQEGEVFCSVCGQKLETSLWESWPEEPSPGAGWYYGLVFLAMAMVLLVLGLGAWGAYQGLQERASVDMSQAQAHYQRGVAYLEEGNYPLAVAEFEEAVRLNPQDQETERQLLRARTLAEAQATPTSEALVEAADVLYQAAVDFYNQGDFWAAIDNLEQLRRLTPQYLSAAVSDLLFQSYLEAGKQEVAAAEVESALAKFDAALALRPEDPAAAEEKRVAALYLEAIGMWGQDWLGVVERLQEIYSQYPQYADVPHRLREAHLAWAVLFVEQEEWCQAEREFSLALEISPDAEVSSQRDDAAGQCRASQPSIITPTASP